MTRFHCLALVCATLFTFEQAAHAADTLHVEYPHTALMVERSDNVVAMARIKATSGEQLDAITLTASNISDIKSIKLYYSGTDRTEATNRFVPINYIERSGSRNLKSANPHFSVLIGTASNLLAGKVSFNCKQKLVKGINYFWVSVELKKGVKLSSRFNFAIDKVVVDGGEAPIEMYGGASDMRVGVGVRYAGDDGVDSYRIPGFVTTKKGTLLGIYDVRYDNSVDLQGKVDVGVSRSTDKGYTWEPMRIAMDMGTYGGLPTGQNGIGDPAILVDEVTGDIIIVAVWAHGMGNNRLWTHSRQGMSPIETGQLMISRSSDDGITWSAPINITSQVKHPSQRLFFNGPGMGITMKDGTLVFAAQYIDSTNMPYSTIIYSKDRGNSWHTNAGPRSNTTEAQVVEITPGVLMLNMRDNRGGSRAVATTTDMGATWSEHISSRSALQEPVCMASVIAVDGVNNAIGKNIVLFSNPNTTNGRHSITIKASIDGGKTFPTNYQVLLDDGESWGYSCLTMIDKQTVGILYEGSTAHMVFQAIPLTDIIVNKL